MFLVSTILFGQTEEKMHNLLPMKNGRICYSKVIEVPGVSKSELYDRAYAWFVSTYKSAKDVIQMADKESGKIIGKGWFTHPFSKLKVDHSVTITVKDGRYKYTITDFVFNDRMNIGGIMTTLNETMEDTYREMNPERKIYAKNINKFNDYLHTMIQTIKDAMNKTAPNGGEQEDDNW